MDNNGREPKPMTWNEMHEIANEQRQKVRYFGDWRVDTKGNISHKRNPEYWIPKDELKEDDWVLHMSRKDGVDLNEFFLAFSEACKRAGVYSRQRVSYWKPKKK